MRAAFLFVDVVDDFRDWVADADTQCGLRDRLALLVNEANELTAFVVGNGNVLFWHANDFDRTTENQVLNCYVYNQI